MKKLYTLGSQPDHFGGRKLRQDSSRQLLHSLLDQLSVLNLCSFKMRGRQPGCEGIYEQELKTIERSITDAAAIAEALKVIWDKPTSATHNRRAPQAKKPHGPRLKIVPAGIAQSAE